MGDPEPSIAGTQAYFFYDEAKISVKYRILINVVAFGPVVESIYLF